MNQGGRRSRAPTSDKQSKRHLSLSFCIQFLKHRVNIVVQHVLTFIIKRKIALVSDDCSRCPIIIRSHDLHVSDIRGAMGEIISYQEMDYLFPFFLVHASCSSFGLFLAFPFCLPCDGFNHWYCIGFSSLKWAHK